jgi:hypothetical protein
VFDFGAQQEIAYLDLPHPAANLWCASADLTEAYVAEFEPSRGRTAVRHVDLVNLVDLGSVPVGDAASREFDDMTLADGQLFVTTSTPLSPSGYTGWLTRVRFSSGTPIAVIEGYAQNRLPRIAAVTAVDRLLVSRFMPFVPATGLFETSLSSPRTHLDIALPWFYLVANDIAVEGSDAWVLDSGDNEPPGGTEPGRLYRLDMGTHAWTQYPHTWAFVGPRDMEIVHDALVDKIYLANRGFGPPMNIAPELFVIDRAHASEGHVLLANSPEVLCGSTLD